MYFCSLLSCSNRKKTFKFIKSMLYPPFFPASKTPSKTISTGAASKHITWKRVLNIGANRVNKPKAKNNSKQQTATKQTFSIFQTQTLKFHQHKSFPTKEKTRRVFEGQPFPATGFPYIDASQELQIHLEAKRKKHVSWFERHPYCIKTRGKQKNMGFFKPYTWGY